MNKRAVNIVIFLGLLIPQTGCIATNWKEKGQKTLTTIRNKIVFHAPSAKICAIGSLNIILTIALVVMKLKNPNVFDSFLQKFSIRLADKQKDENSVLSEHNTTNDDSKKDNINPNSEPTFIEKWQDQIITWMQESENLPI